jgi:hypothetical protein
MLTNQEVNMASDDATADTLKAALARMTAVGGPLNGAKIGLLKTAITPALGMTIADLDPATYDGYVEQTITWSAPVLDESGKPYLPAGISTWVPTGSATIGTQQVTGIFIRRGDDTTKLGYARNLESPVTVTVGVPLSVVTCVGDLIPTNRE